MTQLNEDFSRRSKLRDIGRWFVTRFVEETAGALAPGSSVLDAGAGECVYKRFFSHCDYRAIDLAVGEEKWNYGNLDYVGPLHDMPIPSDSFDAVLCTQVLEHAEWPRESVKEMYRVLKPGGRLFITVPMSQGEHQIPYDFFRYTSYGLRSMCRHAGFGAVEVRPFGGLLTRWAYELPRSLALFPSAGILAGAMNPKGLVLLPAKAALWLAIVAAQVILLCLDPLDKVRNDPWGWCVIATK